MEFRVFKYSSGSQNFRNLLRWNRFDNETKRVMGDSRQVNIDHMITEIVKIVDNEDKISLTHYTLSPAVTHSSAFIRSNIEFSVTYRKDSKKFYSDNMGKAKNLFCGGTVCIKSESLDILEALGLEAINEYGKYPIAMYLTKITLKAIITGRCTNFNDLVKRYYSSIGIKNMNRNRAIAINKINFGRQALRVAKNQDNLFKWLGDLKARGDKTMSQTIADTVDMAHSLQRKIDFKWSHKRFKLEHDNMMYKIFDIRKDFTDDQVIDYKDLVFPTIEGIELLDTTRELFVESFVLNHCLGTSSYYFNNANTYKTVLLRYDRHGFRGSAEISLSPDYSIFSPSKTVLYVFTPKINQFKGKFNVKPDEIFIRDLENLIYNELHDFLIKVHDLRDTDEVMKKDILDAQDLPFFNEFAI